MFAGRSEMETNGAGSIEELRATFADLDLEFRHYPNCKVSFMSWQAGRVRCIEVEADGACWFDELYELVACGSTPGALIDKLTTLP